MTENGSFEKVTREKVDRLRDDFDKHAEKQGDEAVRMWNAIDSLKNRLPNWAVFTLSALMGVCGWAISAATRH
jgi:hypothetical protein